MNAELRLALAFAVAAVAAYLLTPVAIKVAGRFDFFDKPKGYKGHAKPIPYLGGAAVLSAFLIAVLLFAGDAARTLPILGGVAVLWVVGTIDDRRHVSPGLRVLIEIAIASAIWKFDLGWNLGLGGGIDLFVTVMWVLLVVNAFNLFDNMDGASSTMAVAVSGTVAVLGAAYGDPWLAAIGAALAGGCVGFLPYNLARPQARIFLGDGGSMPIGFALAALVMAGASTAASGVAAFAVGLLLVGIPALDTTLVIISRRRKGISVLTGGRDHLTHRTRRRVGTARAVAITLGGMQVVIASVTLVALNVGPSAIITATVVVVAVASAAITMLEREEDRLLAAGEVYVPDQALEEARAKRERRPDPHTIGDLALVILSLGAALSPLALGFYDSTAWVPIGLGVSLIAAMGAIRRPQRLTPEAWVALGGLGGIGYLALLSAQWAPSADQAIETANRWLVLALVLGLALVLVRSTRRDRIAVAFLGLGTLAIGAIVLVRMIGPNGGSLFLVGRLHEPLGYINAEATVFLMGVWLCMAAAERPRAWIAGAGLGGATALASLSLLSASRGAAIAAIASTLLVLLAVPGRQRRAFALLALSIGLAIAARPVLNVYDAALANANVAPQADIRRAALFVLLGSFVSAAIWGFGVALYAWSQESHQRVAARAGRIAMALAAGVTVIVLLASAGSLSSQVADQFDAFTDVAKPGETVAPVEGSRLVSGSGNRYEYWRVAVESFKDHPLEGIGAGNYDRAWFAKRSIAEDVRQPHSIQLQVLSEEGLIGGVFLLLVIGAFLYAAARVHRTSIPGTPTGRIAVSAVGVPAVWLAHTSVDWMHLIPGTTAVALIMLAVLLRQSQRLPKAASQPADDEDVAAAASDPDSSASRPRFTRARAGAFGGAVVIALAVATAGGTLTRQAFADHYRSEAFDVLNEDPRAAIVEADRSLRLNGDAVRSYYAKAAALARLNQGPAAEAALLEATRRDASNPVTWALLGDLATRRGNASQAKLYYERALSLNPLDPGLQALVSGAPGTP